MHDRARECLVWLRKPLDADGFCFDAVKYFPAYMVEEVLANATQNRCGTFDFGYRNALANIIASGDLFDQASLRNFQQGNRLKTSPFVNNHDTWRGTFWDSNRNPSLEHDDREGDWRKRNDELAPIAPAPPRLQLTVTRSY
jgi:hypothetical protein